MDVELYIDGKEPDPKLGLMRAYIEEGINQVLIVKLSNKAKEKDIEGAEVVARQVLAIAEAQHWFQMRVVVHSSLGAAYLQVEDFSSALRAYRTVTDVSREATAVQDLAQKKHGLFGTAANVPEEDEVNDRMVDLLGEDWRDSIVTGSQGATPS